MKLSWKNIPKKYRTASAIEAGAISFGTISILADNNSLPVDYLVGIPIALFTGVIIGIVVAYIGSRLGSNTSKHTPTTSNDLISRNRFFERIPKKYRAAAIFSAGSAGVAGIRLNTSGNIPIEEHLVRIPASLIIGALVGMALTFIRSKLRKNNNDNLKPFLTTSRRFAYLKIPPSNPGLYPGILLEATVVKRLAVSGGTPNLK